MAGWLERTLRSLATRAVVYLVTATSQMQTVQIKGRGGKVKSGAGAGIEHFEPFGFTSKALPGAEAILLNLGATATHAVAIIIADRRFRPTDLANGEACVHDAFGHRIHLKSARVEVVGDTNVAGALGGTTVRSGDGLTGSWTEPDTGQVLTFTGGVLTGAAPPLV